MLSLVLAAMFVSAPSGWAQSAGPEVATPAAQPANQLPSPQADTVPPPPPGTNAALDSARAVRGQSLKVSLITYGASEIVFERFGHDALAIRDTLTGQDYAYNWGVFAFQQPNFVARFLTGETRYWMQPYPTAAFNQGYIADNRSIRVQQLALSAVERAALLEFAVWNSAEANKYYRYDYYQDNCATRVRDALDRVLKGRLKAALDTGSTNLTWRSETERVTASSLPVYAGIELALGRNADKRLTQWQASFMPERLADAIGNTILRTDDGQRYRLASRDSIVFQATRVPMPIDPPERMAMAALIGLTLAGLVALLTDSRFRVLRGLLLVLVATWYVAGGVLGTALLIAGTATKHAPYMGSNTTLWQIHPILLFAALFVPVALARREATNSARALVAVSALFSVFGALLQFVPMFSQRSGLIIAVTLPVHLAIAFAVLRMPVAVARRRAAAT
ncbi:MAG: DUF4105 domain-containing protein [Phycisphaerae bacterium]|nr:DUF4105 domain-containing protein [Gemmatimonadaceae bacterium]